MKHIVRYLARVRHTNASLSIIENEIYTMVMLMFNRYCIMLPLSSVHIIQLTDSSPYYALSVYDPPGLHAGIHCGTMMPRSQSPSAPSTAEWCPAVTVLVVTHHPKLPHLHSTYLLMTTAVTDPFLY